MLGLARSAVPALQHFVESSLRAALVSSGGAAREYASQVALTNTGRKAGHGGRSSVSGITATVFGGYGFVGSYVVNRIAQEGSQVVVPFRSTENHVQHIKQMGDLGQIVMLREFDIRDDAAVKKAISRSNVVVNLVGQRMETMNFKFEDTHIAWPTRLAKFVAESPNVERLIHFSDIGADEKHASRRLSTKAAGDKALMEIFPNATIVKPAPIVGIEDHFFNYLIYQVSFGFFAPVIDGGVARVQPTYVPDVAEAVMQILRSKDSAGKTYHLGGPEVLTYRQVYDVINKTLRMHTDDTVHVPAWLAKAMFAPKDWARSKMPNLPMSSWMSSANYVEEVIRDKIVPKGALGYADLEIQPQPVTDGLAIEPVRHYRVGGYRWGDMANVAKDVPENIRKYYNIK